ncbi:MAG: hypothetical protein JWO06_787 [Bacteroidota bacterium]|nr:hypothetical protein [Bacteroidota bacterium]
MKTKVSIATTGLVLLMAFMGLSFQAEKPLFEKNGLKVYELKGSPDYPDAELSLKSPAESASLKEGKDTFNFEVKNYELGMQTPDAGRNMCANSAKGQHIHFIMDNTPYVASYTPQVVNDMKPGHHVLLAFLSRSYHESLKHKKSFVLKEFNVGKETKSDFDAKAPHVFLSRPKGEYINSAEIARVMLDFYLVNCDLSPKGYKVRATINGTTEFTFTKWAPYVIEGLPQGENKVKLELLDKNGALVKSPFNGMERSFSLKMEPFK